MVPGATCWRGSGAEKKDGRKVEDNWELDYDLDRFFDEHWFWRGSYSQKHDAIDNLERQSALGTGPGYQFWDDELGRFRPGRRDQSLATGVARSAARGFHLLFAGVGTTSGCSPGPGWSCTAKGTVLVPGIERIDYLLDSEYGLRYRLNSWARLSFLMNWTSCAPRGHPVRPALPDRGRRRLVMRLTFRSIRLNFTARARSLLCRPAFG